MISLQKIKNLSVNKSRKSQKLMYIISCVLKVTVTLKS